MNINERSPENIIQPPANSSTPAHEAEAPNRQAPAHNVRGGHNWAVREPQRQPRNQAQLTIAECRRRNLEAEVQAPPQPTIQRATWARVSPNQAAARANDISFGIIRAVSFKDLPPKEAAAKVISLWSHAPDTNKESIYNALNSLPGGDCDKIVSELKLADKEVLFSLAKFGISHEVANERVESELMRGNTVATKAMTAVLRSTFEAPLMERFEGREFADLPSFVTILPNGNKELKQDNLENLKAAVESVLAQIAKVARSSSNEQSKELFEHLQSTVNLKFENAGDKHIVTTFLLRVANPVLTDSVVKPNPNIKTNAENTKRIRENAILISKMLQNLANSTTFREDHMVVLNNFIAEKADATQAEILHSLIDH